jgi:hypothetical protein
MSNPLCSLLRLASVLALHLASHADAIDDFVLTGGGQTITYSLPATSSFPDFDLFNFFNESAPTKVNGVSVGIVAGDYYVFLFDPSAPALVLNLVDPAGNPTLILTGPQFFSFVTVPASNPPPYLPYDIVPTFIPGTYDLQTLVRLSPFRCNPFPTPSPSPRSLQPLRPPSLPA